MYSYINFLGNKNVTATPMDPIDLMTILNNIQTVLPSYLSLPRYPNTNIWSFYKFLKIHPLVYNNTLFISLIGPLLENTFHLQLDCMHTVTMFNTALFKIFQINLQNTYFAITNDEKYFTCPIDLDILKCLGCKGHYCSLAGGLYPIHNKTVPLPYILEMVISPLAPF